MGVTVDCSLPYRLAWHDGVCIATEDRAQYESLVTWAVQAGPIRGKKIAWIGGGFCVGPRVFSIADCIQTVFELEPFLAEFCPNGVQFVPGDYRDTMVGAFDVIVYDLGGEVPREFLSQHLNSGGIILPLV